MTHKNKILYLANAKSIHVKTWIDITKTLPVSIRIMSIYLHQNRYVRGGVNSLLMSLIPKNLQYVFLGLLLRFSKKNERLIHAHCASGYGMAALISKRDYIVTIYGSEIYGYKKRNFIYRCLIKKVLLNARKITVTTRATIDFIESEFFIGSDKIENVNCGISSSFARSNKILPKRYKDFFSDVNGVYVFSIRRITEHYRIDYIISEFESSLNEKLSGIYLVLAAGDYSEKYLIHIKKLINRSKHRRNILLISEFLNQSEVASIISNVTYVVSLAKTDQMSSTIMESIYLGVPPVINNLSAYQGVINSEAAIVLPDITSGRLKNVFLNSKESLIQIKRNMETFKKVYLNKNKISNQILRLYVK